MDAKKLQNQKRTLEKRLFELANELRQNTLTAMHLDNGTLAELLRRRVHDSASASVEETRHTYLIADYLSVMERYDNVCSVLEIK
jgi:uncharacterized protein YfaA (DUF2138 family)